MGIHRLKHSFSAGELSPLMESRVDFARYNNGCTKLRNMLCVAQGPVTRRTGFKFIYDLTSLGLDTADPQVRAIPFIFNELQAYALIFFMHTDGSPRMVVADQEGLVVHPDPVHATCTGATPGAISILTLPSDWDIVNMDWAQSADEVYIAQSGDNPHSIKRHSAACWELVSLTFTAQPTEWSAGNGWPERVTFHQQRLVYAASTLYRQTVWMSKAGDFSDFGVSAPLVDSDAITFTLDSGTQNKIVWLLSAKSLNIGTIGNEWTVTGSTQNALTPSNILAQRQTNNGGEQNKPLMVGITTLFVERHGRVINEFVYDYTLDSYKTSDMSVLSNHVTEQYSIVDWTYQQTPNGVIWSVREDGALLGITYQRHHKVIGWHIHSTEGEFKAITSVPGDTREDEVWVIVKRTINSVTKYYLEKKEVTFEEDDALNARFLDCFYEYSGTAISTVTGLDHLNGEEVDIIADGTVHPSQTVASNQITLNDEYSNIAVGFNYTSEIWPTLPEIADKTGSVIGRKQRVTNIDVDLYRSLGMYIGRYTEEEGESEEEIPFRQPGDLTGVAVPLFTGIYHWEYMEGFDRDTTYFIRQKQPLPLTVRAVVDTIEVYE